ncbi:TPA: tRNA (guanosine(46)-N7)-methyltransferase TrmB [Candidatus Bipolaricaulota bacterium]|nr:tRNA (guanosine(46)-N7)-methyltransferase TrmB [Candidatus Bipolaricaulota bacterium]
MALEVARYLVEPRWWEKLPGDWKGVFGRDAPLAVEIGFGNGEFLAWAAKENPDWNFVGFELALTCFVKAGKRLASAGVENVRLARVDGAFGLRELFPNGSLSRVYLHFPCPWPKARHASRRLVNERLARTLASVLAPAGIFELTTDVDWYAREAADILSSTGRFSVRGPVPLTEGGPDTRYERKWRLEGRRIFRVEAELVRPGKVDRLAEGTMPHARIKGPVPRAALLSLAGLKETWPEGAFVIKEIFLASNERAALVRAFAVDEGFQQQYFIAVVRGPDGWMVKLDGATLPFRTPAVKRSVAAVAAALEKRGQA